MTAPLIAVLVIAVGPPLLAWWVARRPYWSRPPPAPSGTPGRTWSVGTGCRRLLVARLASGEPVGAHWSVVLVWMVVGIWGVRRRALRRAIERNDEPAAEGR